MERTSCVNFFIAVVVVLIVFQQKIGRHPRSQPAMEVARCREWLGLHGFVPGAIRRMRLVERVRRGFRVDLPALLEAEALRIHLHRRGQHGHREHRKDRELVHFSFRVCVSSVPRRRRKPDMGRWVDGWCEE